MPFKAHFSFSGAVNLKGATIINIGASFSSIFWLFN